MKRLFVVACFLAFATAASGSISYSFDSGDFIGTETTWQFTVPDFLTAPSTIITVFDSSSSTLVGTILSVEIDNPDSTGPEVITSGTSAGLDTLGWTGPFNQDGLYTVGTATLTITGTPDSSVPEPSALALVGAGGILLAIVQRRRRIFLAKSCEAESLK